VFEDPICTFRGVAAKGLQVILIMEADRSLPIPVYRLNVAACTVVKVTAISDSLYSTFAFETDLISNEPSLYRVYV